MMDVRQKLRLAQQAADEGRFEEALQGHIWYHNNALTHAPSHYGVRLSFALSDWVRLGQSYPPALTALKDIRDRKTRRLIEGNLNRHLFHDVCSINKYLRESNQTYRLFLQLYESAPTFAEECTSLALPVIIENSDFVLARRLLKEPESWIRDLADRLNLILEHYATYPPKSARQEEIEITMYTGRVKEVLNILTHVGETEEATRLQTIAINCVQLEKTRKAVEQQLNV